MNKLIQKESDAQVIKNESRFKKFEIYGDMNTINRTFERHGHITMNVAVKDTEGGFTLDSGNYMWINQNNFSAILPNKATFYPHEEAQEVAMYCLENNLKGTGLKLTKEIENHNGRTKYWTIMSDEKFKVQGNDDVQVGIVVRNGIGTNVALGVDLYTFRLWCTNGAVARGKNLGSFSIKHVGNVQRMRDAFAAQMIDAFENVKELITMYRRATQIKMNEKLVNKMYEKLVYNERYLPDNWNILPRKEVKEKIKAGSFKGSNDSVKITEEISLWETFNRITEKHRDGLEQKKINFTSASRYQIKLHQAMQTVITYADKKGI